MTAQGRDGKLVRTSCERLSDSLHRSGSTSVCLSVSVCVCGGKPSQSESSKA